MALGRHHLRVASGVWVPWVNLHYQPDGFITGEGVAITFMDIIADKLNFTYSLVTPEDMEWGRRYPNGSFSGMIGMCERKEVDVALGPFAINYERSQVADFSQALFVEAWHIFLPRPHLSSDLAGFLKPFAWQVWVTLAVVLGVSVCLGGVFGRVGKRSGVKDKKFCTSWIVRAIMIETIAGVPKGLTERMMLGAWFLGALILSSAYQGLLTSLLTVPLVNTPIDTLQDLVDHGKLPWAIEAGTILELVFAEADSKLYRQVYSGAELVDGAWHVRERVKRKELAVLADVIAMRKIMHDDFASTSKCHYYISKEVIRTAPLAFAFPKGSPLIQHFNKWMAPLQESGLVSRSVQDLTSNATACLLPPGMEGALTTVILTLPDMAGVFILVAAGLVLGSICCLVECLVFKMTHK